jgi:transketolase
MTLSQTLSPSALDELCINTLRFLAVDMVQKANSGHPGLPLGSAAMVFTLWDRFLKVNPSDPDWPDRDRFVLSAGHGCALLYALLHVTGFDLPLAQLKRFRQWDSQTPGHPEYGKTPGVEATTGPLGQGFGNAVGMAIAEMALAARFNRPSHVIVDHHTYAVVSDGDLMEGVCSEAASLAGHLRLNKLIVLYADNGVSLAGSTDLTFTEDRVARFAAYGWHTRQVECGNDAASVAAAIEVAQAEGGIPRPVEYGNDADALAAAIEAARAEEDRPSFIAVRTHLGYGSPHKQDTFAAHGSPLGAEEVRLTKENLGWPVEPSFYIPPEALQHFHSIANRGATRQREWESTFKAYADEYPDLAAEFQRVIQRKLPEGWEDDLPFFRPREGPIATRVASGKMINVLAQRLPEMMGGDGDLAPSTHTLIEGSENFEPRHRAGRNLRFGVREHAMGAILNGMALHRGLIPYGATFLIFSDYMRPPIRLAAMNGLPVIYIFTHDSIGMGQDGPTHQPIEQLLGLRSVPGLIVIRPADANETIAAWRMAVASENHPTALVLSRQKLPVLDVNLYPGILEGVSRGGYVLAEAGKAAMPNVILIATGSEVHLALNARDQLAAKGVKARVVSLPCWSLFKSQPESYQAQVLPKKIPTVAIEAGVTLGWEAYLGPHVAVLGVDRFGASAPGDVVMREYGFTVENVCQHVMALLKGTKTAPKGRSPKHSTRALQLKRVQDKPARNDGLRILIDRALPLGITRQSAAIDLWVKDVAPSAVLRKWFDRDPAARWKHFQVRYRKELAKKKGAIDRLKQTLKGHAATLVYSAKDERHNQAVVLKELLEAIL